MEHVLSFFPGRAPLAFAAAHPSLRRLVEIAPSGYQLSSVTVQCMKVADAQAKEYFLYPPEKCYLVYVVKCDGQSLHHVPRQLQRIHWWLVKQERVTAFAFIVSKLLFRHLRLRMSCAGRQLPLDDAETLTLTIPNSPISLSVSECGRLLSLRLSRASRGRVLELRCHGCDCLPTSVIARVVQNIHVPLRVLLVDKALSLVRLPSRHRRSLRHVAVRRKGGGAPFAAAGALGGVAVPGHLQSPGQQMRQFEEEEEDEEHYEFGLSSRQKRRSGYTFPNLRWLRIADSMRIALSPVVSRFSSLCHLFLLDARIEVLKIPPGLSKLETLSLKGCIRLRQLLHAERLRYIRSLTLNNCDGLREWNWLYDIAPSLDSLDIQECHVILPEGEGDLYLTSLTRLKLSGVILDSLYPFLNNAAPELVVLHLQNINTLDDFDQLPELPRLVEVTMIAMMQMSSLCWLQFSQRMRQLILFQCVRLSSIALVDRFPDLRVLQVSNCIHVESLSGIESCKRLERLCLSSFSKLQSFSPLGGLVSLREVEMMRLDFDGAEDFSWIATCPMLHRLVLGGGVAAQYAREMLRRLNRTGVIVF